MTAPRGTLVAIGGNEDKDDDMKILRRTIDAVRGNAERVEVIASASRDPREAARPYLRAFDDMGIRHVDALDIRDHRDANEPRTLERLKQADVIFFTGGDQVRLVETFEGSDALDVIHERYQNGAVVAGTSAGAAAMSATMIARGEARKGLEKGTVETSRGLGLLPHTVIDTHFIQRGRFSRLLSVITRAPDLVGLGICEDTAFIVRQGHKIEVVGADTVIVVDGHAIVHTNKEQASEGDSLAVEHAIVHALAEGYTFDLHARKFGAPGRAKKEVTA